jgi:hypothetical protein
VRSDKKNRAGHAVNWVAAGLPEFLPVATRTSKKHHESPKGFRRYVFEREELTRSSKKGEQNS